VRASRREQRANHVRTWFSRVLIAGGLALILVPLLALGFTYARQELVIRGIIEVPSDPVVVDPDPETPAPGTGEPPASLPTYRISIPKIKLSAQLVYGITKEDLKHGPGIYPQGVLPGERGNLAIAGHRTSAGSPFLLLHRLETGDEIVISSAQASYVYGVERVFIVEKTDWSVLDPLDYYGVTLTTCHPIGSVRQRLIVSGKLVRVEGSGR